MKFLSAVADETNIVFQTSVTAICGGYPHKNSDAPYFFT